MNSLLNSLAGHAEKRASAIALRSGNNCLNYAQLQQLVEQAAWQLRVNGAESLGIFLDNGCDWIIADLAAMTAGIRVVPLPWFFSERQIEHAIRDGGVDFIVYAGSPPAGIAGSGAPLTFGLTSRLLAIAPRRRNRAAAATPSGKLSYTSGSTGAPRGITLSYPFIERTSQAIRAAIGDIGIESHLSLLPYATLLENIAGIYVPLLLGKTVNAESAAALGLSAEMKADPRRFAQTFERVKPNSLILTPRLLADLCGLVESGEIDPTCLRFAAVGGARVGETLLRRARRTGIPAYEGYGLTEFGSVASLNTPADDRTGSVGKPLPGVGVKIAGDGEICLVSELQPGAPLATGDYGRIDADGYLYVHGRKSNLIVLSNGRNVSPEWVETEICASTLVAQCCVFSADDNDLSALLVAVAPNIPDARLEREIARINRTLPAYARIGRWHRMPYPFTTNNQMLTANGRLRRAQIKQMLSRILADSRTFSPPSRGTPNNPFVTGENSMQEKPFFDEIEAITAAARARLQQTPAIARCLAGQAEMQTYQAFLAEAYHHVKHTVPLLMACGSRLPERLEWLREAIVHYIEEEIGHQEWILNDIENLGGDSESVRHGKPSLPTELMVSYAWDTVTRGNPVGLFGMVYTLEKTSSTIATRAAGQIASALELAPKAMTYMVSHGSLDIEHMQHFEKLMNRLDHESDREAVRHAALVFYELYRGIFEALPLDEDRAGETSHAA